MVLSCFFRGNYLDEAYMPRRNAMPENKPNAGMSPNLNIFKVVDNSRRQVFPPVLIRAVLPAIMRFVDAPQSPPAINGGRRAELRNSSNIDQWS